MNETKSTKIGLHEAAKLMDSDRQYVLKLIKTGKIPAEKVQEGNLKVWKVERADVEAYAKTKGTRSTDPNAPRTYSVKLTAEVAAAIEKQYGIKPVRKTYKTKAERAATPKKARKARQPKAE